MTMETYILTYGYAAVVIGSFFEGETVIVLAGFAAHQGYLKLPFVLAFGFLGAVLGDQLYFHIGRIKGLRVLNALPHGNDKSRRIFALLDRHQLSVILGFRFLYGMRIITPFLLGALGISSIRFLILNIIGAFIWTLSIGIFRISVWSCPGRLCRQYKTL
jgi:membrane protein DedA with SNARE-associated domain